MKQSKNNPFCPYCGSISQKVTGKVTHPAVKRMKNRVFYYCAYDHKPAYVSAHSKTGRPMGTLASATLRGHRQLTHEAFDPLWQAKGAPRRNIAYQWLAQQMGLPKAECHIALFDIARCQEAQRICTERLAQEIAAEAHKGKNI